MKRIVIPRRLSGNVSDTDSQTAANKKKMNAREWGETFISQTFLALGLERKFTVTLAK